MYSYYEAGPSGTSLIGGDDDSLNQREDDEAHLTANMAQFAGNASDDPERSGATPNAKRRRYSVTPSPLKMGTTLKRMSLRVVNLAGTGLGEQLKLQGEDELDEPGPPPDLKEALPIRGRTLGFLGSDSRIRQGLFRFLVHPITEPAILVLIILNAVTLTCQAFPSLTLPTANGPTLPPEIKGYFHTWEDYVLFALFIVFT